MMKGNIYGLDIKLTPESSGAGKTPIVIEINGSNFGTDFFRYPEGMSYYRKFARVLGAHAQGKPIYVEEVPTPTRQNSRIEPEFFELVDRVNIAMAEGDNASSRERVDMLFERFGPYFRVDTQWMDDRITFRRERIGREIYDPEDKFHIEGGKLEGVEVIAFREMSYVGNSVRFKLPDGRIREESLQNVGMIKSADELSKASEKYRGLFLSTPFTEGVTDSKVLSEMINRISQLEYSSVPSVVVGGGLTEFPTFESLINTTPLFVRKPSGESGGVGTTVLDRDNAKKYIDSFKMDVTLEDFAKGALGTLGKLSVGVPLDQHLTILQPFIPSIPLAHPMTGEHHDGCARVVVYSPPSGVPIVLGSQWRLAPHPMNEERNSLEDRFRANLCRGALAVPIHPDDLQLIEKYAVGYIAQFEEAMTAVRNQIIPTFKTRESLRSGDEERSDDVALWRYLAINQLIKGKISSLGFDLEEVTNKMVQKVIST